MVRIKIESLLEYSTEIRAFGGQITKNNIREFVGKSIETNLSRQGIADIENGTYPHKKFIAIIPSVGLADCFV
jgi:hypothetical protein